MFNFFKGPRFAFPLVEKYFENLILNFKVNKGKTISYGLLSLLSLYFLTPTIRSFVFKKQISPGYTKRKDKCTTGLLNNSIYCFANSSLQALSSLPYFTEYLNDFIKCVYEAAELMTLPNNFGVDSISFFKLTAPLHLAMAELLVSLQEEIDSPRNASAINLIRTLESVLHAKLGNGQQDASELTQVVLDALQEESDLFKSRCEKSRIYKELPKLPFLGKESNQFVCMKCHGTSFIRSQSITVLTVQLPQQYSITFQELLINNQIDEVVDYSCLICQIRSILQNEKYFNNFKYSIKEKDQLSSLGEIIENISINEELPETLLNYVRSYNRGSCVTKNIKSTIVKRTFITEYPKVLIVHLSRSVYNGMVPTRNPCRVGFKEHITIQRQVISNNKWVAVEDKSYKLQSLIKHTGMHTNGHYQCYKRKPDFRKDTDTGMTITKTPMVNLQPKSNSNSESEKSRRPKLKKLKTVMRYPFWKLSDSSIQESSIDNVLDETKAAYMLFYEKSR